MKTIGDYLAAQAHTSMAAKREGGVWYSEPEIRLESALRSRGFRFEQQKRIEHRGTTAVLDFLVEGVLVVEVDGREFHGLADQQRDHFIYEEYGYWTLRVPAWKVMRRVEDVVSLIALKLSELRVRPELRKQVDRPDEVEGAPA